MELNLQNKDIVLKEKLFEGAQEQSLDAEITLPDYYPEVSKILNCSSQVMIHNKQCVGDTISIGGQVKINILYLDPDGEINCYENTENFSKSIEAKIDIDGCLVEVEPKINYLNHKATAPRKMELHGSINLLCLVFKLCKESIVSDIECDDVYTKKQILTFVEPSESIRKLSYIEDEISVGNYPPVNKIIRTDCKVEVIECKLLNQKCMVKGDLMIEIVYLSKDSRCFTLRHTHGFSQIIDCDDVNEDTTCNADAKVISFETRLKTTNEGENCAVGFEAKVEIELSCSNKKELEVVCDAFSSVCSINTAIKNVGLIDSIENFKESFVCKKSYELPICGNEVIDCSCELDSSFSAVDNEKLVVKGSVNIGTLYKTSDDSISFYNKPIDFEYVRDDCADSDEYMTRVKIKAVNFTLAGDGIINIEVEIEVSVIKMTVIQFKVLDEVIASECETTPDEKTAIRLYFAEDESVWDIAKKYKTCPSRVCKINCIENIDCMCKGVLLVPNC